jgi:hypothetical protein
VIRDSGRRSGRDRKSPAPVQTGEAAA